jgi:parvulin-like peptidyl-prolyl isomerase
MSIRVNGEWIPDEEVAAEQQAILPRMIEAMPEERPETLRARSKEWAQENVIERVLFRQAAAAGNESVEQLTARITAKLQPPKASDISGYYRKNPKEFLARERVHAAHIVCNVDERSSDAEARVRIEALEARIGAGEDFAVVADEASDCPGRGGDLGFFEPGVMVPEFDEIVFALPAGRRSKPFRTPFGWHLARVIERRPAGVLPFEEVRGRIADALYYEKRQRAINVYVDKLRAQAAIEVA